MNLLEFHQGSSSYSPEKTRKSQNKFQVQKSNQRQADPCQHETVSVKEFSIQFDLHTKKILRNPASYLPEHGDDSDQ